MSIPGVDLRVEIAFNAGFRTAAVDRTWTDVSDYVELKQNVSITYGRQDEVSVADANQLSLTLDNRDGRFTFGNASSPYYPNLKIGRPIRVLVSVLPNPRFETNTTGWAGTNATLTRSTVQAHSGAASMRLSASSAATMSADTPSGTSGQPVAPNERLIVGGWFRANSTGRSCSLIVDWYTAAGASISTVTAASGTDVSGSWTQLRGTVTAPATAAFARLRARVTSPASSELHYVDDLELSRTRFTGYVNEWPVEWPSGGDEYASASISASSRLSRLGLDSPLALAVDQAIEVTGPAYYWPLTEVLGSTSGAEVADRATPLIVAQPTVTFGVLSEDDANLRLDIDGRPGVRLTDSLSPLGGSGGTLTADLPTPLAIDSTNGVTVAIYAKALNGAAGSPAWSELTGTVLSLTNPADDPNNGLKVLLDRAVGSAGADIADAAYGVNLGDTTSVHHLLVTFTRPGGFGEINAYADGTLVGSDAGGLGGPGITVSHLRLAWPFDSGQYRDLLIGRVAIWDRVLTADEAAAIAGAGIGAYEGDTTDERLARYAEWARIPTAELVTTASTVTMASPAVEGAQVVELMRQVETTEAGVLFDDREGNLVLRSRTARYDLDVSLTLDTAGQWFERDYAPKVDRQGLANVGTGTNTLGTVSVTYTDEDSREEYGDAAYNVETAALSTDEPMQLAAAVVNANAQPRPRVPSVTLKVNNWVGDADLVDVLSLDIGTKVRVSNAPAQAPDATADYFAEGYSESFGEATWSITPNLSPAWPNDSVFILDDATFGELDSDNLIAL